MAGTLYLIPTVLAPGTATAVLAPQVREVIGQTDHFLVEEVRTARRFISELKTGRRIEDLHFYDLNKETPAADVEKVLQLGKNGADIGVLSEAGCPGVADPGAVAVRLAHRLGLRVAPLVGPSSLLLALMGSGFSGQSFAFVGYLPIDKEERNKALRQLEREAAQKQQTQLFIETPFRNNALLEAILQTCHPATLLCLACNLTAPDELLRTQTVRGWKAAPPDLHKKPCVFLLFPGEGFTKR